MKLGDLVEPRYYKEDWRPPMFGVIIEIKRHKERVPDYRSQDSFLVLWPKGYEWTWRSEIKPISAG
jgi:hypothetical protein